MAVDVATPRCTKICDSFSVGACKSWSTPRRRHRYGDELFGDLVDDDHVTPTLLGSADEATAPRLRMLERAPSSAAGSVPSRSSVGVSARHVARGGFVVSRTMFRCALVPAIRASLFVSKTVLNTTCRAAAGAGRALVRAACKFVRYAAAPRRSIVDYDGSLQPEVCPDDDPNEADSAQASRVRGGRHTHHQRPGRGRSQQPLGPRPEPLSNVVGGRIRLRNCRNTRIRIEYCRDCVVVATDMESVELLMVCCQRVKLVMRNCSGLVLRELQCTAMGDFVRKGCPNFMHEIVCLRCACKPLSSSGGGSYC